MYQRPSAPRTIGGVLDDSLRLYRASARDWWLPSLLLALISTAAAIYYVLRLGARPTPADMFALYRSPALVLGMLVRIVIAIWLYMTMLASMAATATGEALAVAGAFGKGLRLLPAAVLATILSVLAVGAGVVALVIPGLYVLGRLYFWPAALSIDRPDALGALGASWRMVKGHWWRTAAILTVLTFMLFAMFLVVGFVAGLMAAVARPTALSAIVVIQGVTGVLNVVIAPLFPAAAVATYLDLRLRAEGGDLEARVQDLKPG